MDKIFSFNKFFIGFCALLVVIVFASNYFRDQRIMEQAKVIGKQDGEWSWPSQGISTTLDDVSARILKLTENDAEVEVTGKQKIVMIAPVSVTASGAEAVAGSPAQSPGNPGARQADGGSSSDYKAVLTLYKNGNSRIWLLGKVEEQ